MAASKRGLVIAAEQMELLAAVLTRLRKISGSRLAALVSTSGQPIIVSPGDSRRDTLSLAALAAGSFAATRQLASLLNERQFTLLFHEGERSNLHVVQVNDQVLLLLTFGRSTPVGRVRLYTNRAVEALKAILEHADDASGGPAPTVDEVFSNELGLALDDLLSEEGG